MPSKLWEISIGVLFSSLAFAQSKPVANHRDIKYPMPGVVKVPEAVRFQLPNGMQVLLVEDHELPTINVQAMIRALVWISVFEPTR